MIVDSFLSFSLRRYNPFKSFNLTADNPRMGILDTGNGKDGKVTSSGKFANHFCENFTHAGDLPSYCRLGNLLFRNFSQ